MKHHVTLLQSLVLVSLAAVSSAQKTPPAITTGSTAPALESKDANGKKLDWKRCGDRAVVLFFHSQDMPYSKRALNEVCATLVEEDNLTPELFLLLVTNGTKEVKNLDTALRKTGLAFAITVDENRDKFGPYNVIAFPTIFTLNKERIVLHIAKGYGPVLRSRVLAAARHAAGRISADTYRALVTTHEEPKLTEADIRVNRTIRMVRHLVANGMLEDGRRTLERVLDPDTRHAAGIVALADILLRLKVQDRAALWIGRLRRVDPDDLMLPLLRAELAIQRGTPDEALRLLDKKRATGVRADFLRGCAMELKGQYKEAAHFYRAALRVSLGRGT